ncbi:hypothetical protein BX070DRAFT_153119 [Coemansia spiralis]|nr:hypothetical protein BX070DRAFT_153119 [Coemansia spiralis]
MCVVYVCVCCVYCGCFIQIANASLYLSTPFFLYCNVFCHISPTCLFILFSYILLLFTMV